MDDFWLKLLTCKTPAASASAAEAKWKKVIEKLQESLSY